MCIALWNSGAVRELTWIDVADARLASKRWYLSKSGYAYRREHRNREIRLAREVLGLTYGDGRQVDHINRNRLDNTRGNLRVVTAAQNAQNMPSRGRSRYRGVSFDTQHGLWRAQGQVAGRRVRLGRFATELEAARVAQEWRRANMPFAVEPSNA